MVLLQNENGDSGSFYMEEDGNKVASITYTISPEQTLTIDHTNVDKALQGNEIGFKLVQKTVEYARSKQWKVVPDCSFARAVINRAPEMQDVI